MKKLARAVIWKSVTSTEQQESLLKSQIEAKDFTNQSEYIQNLIRCDQ